MNGFLQRRAKTVASLVEKPLDLLVIGGGIVGAGIIRDAAMRGLRAGLVEQHDFASGTSSRSSRLLHGGIRYLAQGRVGLVHEASVEKKIIHEIAPHLADPLPFLFPSYRANKEWVLWQLKIGVKIYDLLCSGKNLGNSSWLNARETLQRVPGLSPEGLTGAVRYFDGFTNDARLVLDTLRSAARHGATLANYCRFLDATQIEPGKQNDVRRSKQSADNSPSPGGEGRDEGGLSVAEARGSEIKFDCDLWKCNLTDALSGTTLIVQAKTIVNATGPWADRLPHSRVKLRLAKGVHLVMDRARIPVPDTVVMTEGKRILFAIPWGERTILGTTDTDYNGPLDRIFAESADIRYILEITNRFFPTANLSQNDVISSWAGVRPLIADPHGSPSDISRSHQIRNPEPGWWDVAGGKLTTYRLMAEETVNQIIHALKRAGLKPEPASCSTAKEPLLPQTETTGISGILPPEFSRDVVRHFCENEWAVHLDDIMVRRTSWHYYYKDADARARQVAAWVKEFLDWPDDDAAKEIKHYHELTHLTEPRA
ncbi:MAG TPA: glycerol-3-phosphate dehydrogenase/oxidase [Candidatus Acidoferrales bacterium]|nr:glycerol-3-phosphate dehydrogenase/oxidase [Candidatus Acidoferrales bacterium]